MSIQHPLGQTIRVEIPVTPSVLLEVPCAFSPTTRELAAVVEGLRDTFQLQLTAEVLGSHVRGFTVSFLIDDVTLTPIKMAQISKSAETALTAIASLCLGI